MRRWLRRAGGVVLVLATLIIGQAIIKTKPTTNDLTQRPFLVAGRIHEGVTVDGVTVELVGVRGATRIKQPNNSFILDTDGVWIIVRLKLTATVTTASVNYFALADRQGRTFRATGRYKQTMGEGRPALSPGIPVEGEVLFEVPRNAASRLNLRAAVPVYLGRDSLGLRAIADIPIPIPGQDVIYWATDPTPASVMDLELVS